MEQPHYELSVLVKAVGHRNLSDASRHVGLSQPQLSRIVQKLESHYSVVLLDRGSRRHTHWTPMAHQLAEVWSKKVREIDRVLQETVEGLEASLVKMGTLEGLIPVALPFSHALLNQVNSVEMDVYDLNELEGLFSRGELDIIFTSRLPGRRKSNLSKLLGYQSLDQIGSPDSNVKVISTYEFSSQKGAGKKQDRFVISNSLAIRRAWLEKYGGAGIFPSAPRKQKSSQRDTEPVLMVASETFSPKLWEKLAELSIT
jgi:LysR family transcriptional regulator, transcriptional activator for aaeXAB operon